MRRHVRSRGTEGAIPPPLPIAYYYFALFHGIHCWAHDFPRPHRFKTLG